MGAGMDTMERDDGRAAAAVAEGAPDSIGRIGDGPGAGQGRHTRLAGSLTVSLA